MHDRGIAIVTGDQVVRLLEGKEQAVVDAVAEAYRAHAQGDSTLPHSSFLRFPHREKERIIALPAYLGGEFQVAGIKWISSFPENLGRGLERASAVLLLNSLDTGRVYAMLESSVISSMRTGASAALAANVLAGETTPDTIGVVGCGLIAFETLRFLRVLRPRVSRVVAFDLDASRAGQFLRMCRERLGFENATAAPSLDALFDAATLVSFATTATTPHVRDVRIRKGTLILHVSLRDLAPSLILAADNVVDDVDHVCRAATSVHLAEQEAGHRRFIRCTLGDIVAGRQRARAGDDKPFSVFSPFGLGILDIALAQLVHREAAARGELALIDGFHPRSWLENR